MIYQAYCHGTLDEIPAAEWDALASKGDPFLSHAFLAGAERHQAAAAELGWHPRHLALRDEAGTLVGGLPLYVRTHSFGDFSHDWRWAPAFERAGLAYYPKLVSGIPFTPSTGARFLVKPGVARQPVMRQLLAAGLELLAGQQASSWQCLFLDEDADVRQLLSEYGFLWRRGCQFHWFNKGYADFDAFLATFSADKRKKAKRERRRVAEAGLRIEVRHGDEIDDALWTQIYPHYLITFQRFGNHPAFSQAFFAETGRALGRRMVVFIAYDGDRPVATAICYRSDEALYGRHWGSEADYHSLHFELCFYQGIDYCLREGLQRFEPGAQGEHKISRGFSPTPTWAAYWIADPAMRRSIADFLEREQNAMADYEQEMSEHEPFKRFSVADE